MAGSESRTLKKKKKNEWFLKRKERRDEARSWLDAHQIKNGDTIRVRYIVERAETAEAEGPCMLSRGGNKKVLGIVIGDLPIPLEMVLALTLVERA